MWKNTHFPKRKHGSFLLCRWHVTKLSFSSFLPNSPTPISKSTKKVRKTVQVFLDKFLSVPSCILTLSLFFGTSSKFHCIPISGGYRNSIRQNLILKLRPIRSYEGKPSSGLHGKATYIKNLFLCSEFYTCLVVSFLDFRTHCKVRP